MQAVIMAGGKGTRLHDITHDEIPKPMVPVFGKPLLEWQIECLFRNGIDSILIITGHLGNVIKEHFRDWKNISFFEEPEPLGTAGALALVKDRLQERFFLVFGDVLFDIALDKMADFHEDKSAIATLFIHPNSHPYDSDLVVVDDDCKVLRFDSKHNKRDYWYNNLVNAGIYLFEKTICNLIEPGIKTDLEKDVLTSLCEQEKRVFAYSSPEYVKDVGTVDRIRTAEKEIQRGIVQSGNLHKKQKAVFIDRDGTINVYKGLIYQEDQFELEPFTPEALRILNQSDYLAILVTNQPIVARGLCNIDDVEIIHRKMETLLGEKGAYFDAVYYCPHHPDKGYPEENPDYKIPCQCRKPNIGLIEQAVERFNIDLSQSWFIGDTSVDIMTGVNAGTKTALVLTGEAGKDGKYEINPDITKTNFLEVVKWITERQ